MWGASLLVSAEDSRSSGPFSISGRVHCLVFMRKTTCSHSASPHPGVKWLVVNCQGTVAKQQLTSNTVAFYLLFGHSTSRGLSNTPSHFFQDKCERTLKAWSEGNAELHNLLSTLYIPCYTVKHRSSSMFLRPSHFWARRSISLHCSPARRISVFDSFDLLHLFFGHARFFSPVGSRRGPDQCQTLRAKEKIYMKFSSYLH